MIEVDWKNVLWKEMEICLLWLIVLFGKWLRFDKLWC